MQFYLLCLETVRFPEILDVLTD